MSERAQGNRADRRCRGMTRSRMKRTGSIASAGVLVSAGLFGAYVGNPRLQRAYASPVCAGAVTVTGPGDDTLVAALDDSTVTCIKIQGEIILNADLPDITDDSWSGGPRDSGTGLTLYGLGGDDTIDGALNHSGLAIALANPLDDTVHLSVSGLTMANLQSASVASGAVSVFVDDFQPGAVVEVDLAHSTFTDDSTVSSRGGAVGVYVGGDRSVTVSAVDDTFVGNHAGGSGGAIAAYSLGGDVTFHLCGSYFAHNSTPSDGGAIYVYSWTGGDFDVNDHAGCVGTTVFADNTARGTGGAISTNLDAQISDAEFIENVSRVGSSGRGGGAIYGHTVTSNRNTFTGNTSYGGSGGAIASGGTVSSTDDSFAQNVTNFDGGAIYTFGGLNATGSLIGGFNDAQVSGGGVFSKGPVVLDSVVLSQNLAGSRGGGIAVLGASTTMVDSTVSRNMSFRDGGGVYSNSDVTVTSSAIVNNEAYDGGGIRGASATLTNSYVGANRADYFGGIWLATGSRHLGLYFSTVYDNKSTGLYSFQEIGAGPLTAVGSVIASQWTDNTWLATTVDDTAFITDDSLGSWTPGAGSHVLAPGQGLELGTRDDTFTPGHAGRTPLASSPLAVAVAAGGFAPATSPKSTVLLDQLGVTRVAPFTIGARQFVAPSPPSPPTPPSEPPSAPRDPRAVAGDRRAVVSWVAPASSGSFPVTNYQVVASPGGAQCLAAAPALSCTVTGLANGTSYAFRVKALNGAGWSPESAPSHEVTPHGDPAILITGSREGREVKVVGATTGIESSTVVPRFRFAGQAEYQTGLVRPTIATLSASRRLLRATVGASAGRYSMR